MTGMFQQLWQRIAGRVVPLRRYETLLAVHAAARTDLARLQGELEDARRVAAEERAWRIALQQDALQQDRIAGAAAPPSSGPGPQLRVVR